MLHAGTHRPTGVQDNHQSHRRQRHHLAQVAGRRVLPVSRHDVVSVMGPQDD